MRAFDKARWELEWQCFIPELSSWEEVDKLHVTCRKTSTALASVDVPLAMKFVHCYVEMACQSRFSQASGRFLFRYPNNKLRNANRAISFAARLFLDEKMGSWAPNPLHNRTGVLKTVLNGLWRESYGYGGSLEKKRTVDDRVWCAILNTISDYLTESFFKKEGQTKEVWRQIELVIAHALQAPRFPETALEKLFLVVDLVERGEVSFEKDKTFGLDLLGQEVRTICESFRAKMSTKKTK
ncbi:MAG: hypothetical protein ACAH17_02495 [Candidatus Paceibacterota bacterium]